MEIPKYVSEDCVEVLRRYCGRENPIIEKVVKDIRARDAWISLLKVDATDSEVAFFVGSAINMSRDYSVFRDRRRDFISRCNQISRKAADLSNAVKELADEFDDDDFVGAFISLQLTSINLLLFESIRSYDAEEEEYLDIKAHQDAWQASRYWVCAEPDIVNETNNWHKADKLLRTLIPPDMKSEISCEEPSPGSMEFLGNAWAIAPTLSDILDQVSTLTSSESKISFESTIEQDAALISRKSSKKRDYLRALWVRLFWNESEFLSRFSDSRSKLFSIVAELATVILDLDEEDIVTEADVRQTLDQVMPYLENNSREMSEWTTRFRDVSEPDERHQFIVAWRS